MGRLARTPSPPILLLMIPVAILRLLRSVIALPSRVVQVGHFPLPENITSLEEGLMEGPHSLARANGSRWGSLDASDSINFSVYDVVLDDAELRTIHRFNFIKSESGLIPPRKVLLSPNRQLLLLYGIQLRSQNCVAVYDSLLSPHAKRCG